MPAVPACFLDPVVGPILRAVARTTEVPPSHPLHCHGPRVDDPIVFDKLVQVLMFGCSYTQIADPTCWAITIRDRRDEWIAAGVFARLKDLVLEAVDWVVG